MKGSWAQQPAQDRHLPKKGDHTCLLLFGSPCSAVPSTQEELRSGNAQVWGIGPPFQYTSPHAQQRHARTHTAYLEIVCNERSEFTLQQPPGERETPSSSPWWYSSRCLVHGHMTMMDCWPMARGTQARPQKGALSSALGLSLHQCY